MQHRCDIDANRTFYLTRGMRMSWINRVPVTTQESGPWERGWQRIQLHSQIRYELCVGILTKSLHCIFNQKGTEAKHYKTCNFWFNTKFER